MIPPSGPERHLIKAPTHFNIILVVSNTYGQVLSFTIIGTYGETQLIERLYYEERSILPVEWNVQPHLAVA